MTWKGIIRAPLFKSGLFKSSAGDVWSIILLKSPKNCQVYYLGNNITSNHSPITSKDYGKFGKEIETYHAANVHPAPYQNLPSSVRHFHGHMSVISASHGDIMLDHHTIGIKAHSWEKLLVLRSQIRFLFYYKLCLQNATGNKSFMESFVNKNQIFLRKSTFGFGKNLCINESGVLRYAIAAPRNLKGCYWKGKFDSSNIWINYLKTSKQGIVTFWYVLVKLLKSSLRCKCRWLCAFLAFG